MSTGNQELISQAGTSVSRANEVPALQAVNLTKKFGDRTSVNSLSLKVYPGELYSLLGDNGAGKTTTINMLTTLLEPTSGEFFICGHNGVKQPEKTKGLFGVVSQEVALYGELTAWENLQFVADLYAMPAKLAEERIVKLLKRARLADRAHDQVGQFSTGMQRRLSIAISMLHQPRLIFMDEPTVGLDPASRRQIWEALMELKSSGVSVLLTTHYLEEAELLSDRIGIIRKGSMVMEGTIHELREQIRAVQTVTVMLDQVLSPAEVKQKIADFASRHRGTVHYDEFRHNMIFTPENASDITCYVENALIWLKEQNIPFHQFSTTAPSLEDIFLSVTGKAKTAPPK